MTDIELVETTPERLMDDIEIALAAEVKEAIQHYSGYDERSLQSRDFKVGISDLGWCSERTRRMLARMVPDDEDYTAAFIGTALGDHLERACAKRWPDAITQAEVTATLYGETHVYHVTGHPDLIRPMGLLVDFKTTRGLGVVRRTGPSQQQQFQRHTYAKAAWEEGLFDDWVTLDDVTVANVWMDRAGDTKTLYAHAEPYSPEVVEQATWWLDEVVYSHTHNQEARKEPPREMCAVVCGFYNTCRALDTDVEGLLTDEGVLAAVDMYREGLALEKRAKQMKSEAKPHLEGITGSTGEYTVRWTHINGGHVSFDRQSYERLDLKPIK